MALNSSNSEAVVVIGGGFAGLTTALALGSSPERPPIILIEPRSRFVFLPLLYELLSGEIEPWEVAPSYKSLIANKGIVLIDETVKNIETKKKLVSISSGKSIKYSQLVIATGSIPFNFGVEGFKEYAMTFNKLEDIAKMKNLILKLNKSNLKSNNLLIAGAGPTGVELACKVSDLLDSNTQVNLIELSDRVLPQGRSFNQEQVEFALKKRNVKLYLQFRILKILTDGVEIESVKEGESFKFHLPHDGFIWTAGVKPSIPKGIEDCDGGVLINSFLQVLGEEDVFAIGDIALKKDNPWPKNAQLAMQHGHHVAKNILFLRKKEPLEPFEFLDSGEMLSSGIGEATITGLGLTLSGSLAYELRRIAYLSKLPSISLGIRSAASWLITHTKKLI